MPLFSFFWNNFLLPDVKHQLNHLSLLSQFMSVPCAQCSKFFPLNIGHVVLYFLVTILSPRVLRVCGRVSIIHLCVPSAQDGTCHRWCSTSALQQVLSEEWRRKKGTACVGSEVLTWERERWDGIEILCLKLHWVLSCNLVMDRWPHPFTPLALSQTFTSPKVASLLPSLPYFSLPFWYWVWPV